MFIVLVNSAHGPISLVSCKITEAGMTDRKRFLHELGAELDAIDSQLDQYRTEFRAPSKQDAKFDTDEKLRTLEQRREHIRERSRELEDFDGDEWDAARRDIENARDDLKRSLARARNQQQH